MASINKVILVGNLGRDPEVRFMPNGDAVANFSIATTDSWKDKDGNKQQRTEWHNVVAYRKLAEIIGEYVKSGHGIYIEGRLQTRSWEKDGVKRYTTEIIADQMQMLGASAHADNAKSDTNAPISKNNAPSKQESGSFDDFDSESIPF